MNDYYDLGSYSRPISTSSPEAQLWFDRGLLWCYGYNHEEAVRCFQKAAEADEGCAMAYWGVAYASGCNYNKKWEDFGEAELELALPACRAAALSALEHATNISDIERALIKAVEARYQSAKVVSEEHLHAWNDDYADAMREVYKNHPDDLEVATLFAEALINRTPWALWDLKTGQPAEDADTLEAIGVLEKAMRQVEREGLEPHPGVLHIYIHVMEMSPHPERALKAADKLRDLVPDAGHLLHMPSHIDILCGQYYNAVAANDRAIVADNKFLAREGANNFYTFYRSHNFHFKLYAAMFLGQYGAALNAAREMTKDFSDELLRTETPNMADALEGVLSIHLHVYIRFGKWQEIIAEPLPEDKAFYCVTTAMLHYAKAVAHAATGKVETAETHRHLFDEAYATVPDSRRIFNNTCLDILAIAREMMLGEIEYRKENYDAAFAHLRQSVYLDDNLLYAEPWGWMQPTRHALGALLLEQNRTEEALKVYRADLGLDATLSRPSQHPENVWALHGYTECLDKVGRLDEAATIKARLAIASARADVPINASCFCRLEKCCN